MGKNVTAITRYCLQFHTRSKHIYAIGYRCTDRYRNY